MNKKILIASVFATLMLLVPMTSVVGVSDVNEDCGCEVVNRYDLFRVKLLLVRLKVVTNILLLRFGNIPEVAEKCEEILDIINSNRQWDFPIICAILEPIWNQWVSMAEIIQDLLIKYADNPIILDIITILSLPFLGLALTLVNIGASFGCDWVPQPP